MIDDINTKTIAKLLIELKRVREEETDPYCDRCGQQQGVYFEVLEEVEGITFMCPRCIAQRYLKERRYFSTDFF